MLFKRRLDSLHALLYYRVVSNVLQTIQINLYYHVFLVLFFRAAAALSVAKKDRFELLKPNCILRSSD